MSAKTKLGLTEKQIADYYEIFLSFDNDGDKALTIAELAELMKYIGQYNSNFNGLEILKDIDINDNGLVEFEEFLFLLQLQSCDRNKMVNEAFKILDPTGDGVITTESLQKACADLGVNISNDEINGMVAEADPEGKGTIDFQELRTLLKETDDSESDLNRRPTGRKSKRLESIEEEKSEYSDSLEPSEQSNGSRPKNRRKKRKSKKKRKKRRSTRLYRMLWIYTLNAVVRKIHGNMDMYRSNEDNKASRIFPAIPQKNIVAKPASLKPIRRLNNTTYRTVTADSWLPSPRSPQNTYVSYISKRSVKDSPRYSMYFLNPVKKYTDSESVAWFNAAVRSRSVPEYHGRKYRI